jgi:hypothetical protein
MRQVSARHWAASSNKNPVSHQHAASHQHERTEGDGAAHSAMEMQRSLGNRALGRLLQAGAVQAKLSVSQADDVYEREADQAADQVMRMEAPAAEAPCAACAAGGPPCAKCAKKQAPAVMRRSEPSEGGGERSAPDDLMRGIGSGRPLDPGTRAFFEPRFGADFSHVRVHTGTGAESSAQSIGALAYTLGSDVVFNAGQYTPETSQGRRLLAHELAHVVQQGRGIRRSVVQRMSGCSSAQETSINADHARARRMLSRAISEVASYNGTTPSKVFNALSTHFNGATSSAFATWINVNLRFLWGTTWMAGYQCYNGGLFEGTWACGGSALATTFWCVPGVDIRLCPSYFGQTPTERSTTLIHEWVHKYGCNFDLGYEHETGYSGNGTLTQLLNADSFSNFIRDVQ